jgi:hypothetical protein
MTCIVCLSSTFAITFTTPSSRITGGLECNFHSSLALIICMYVYVCMYVLMCECGCVCVYVLLQCELSLLRCRVNRGAEKTVAYQSASRASNRLSTALQEKKIFEHTFEHRTIQIRFSSLSILPYPSLPLLCFALQLSNGGRGYYRGISSTPFTPVPV